MTSFSQWMREHKEDLLSAWKQSVRSDPDVPRARELPEPVLMDQMPALLDALSRGLEGGRTSEDWGRVVGARETTHQHAREREQHGYTLDQALRELALFRRVVLERTSGSECAFGNDERLFFHAALDECMRALSMEIGVRQAHHAKLLADASEILVTSLDPEPVLNDFARAMLPQFADWASVDLVEEGSLRRIATAHCDPNKESLLRDLQRRWPASSEDPLGTGRVLRECAVNVLSEIPEELLALAYRDPEALALAQQVGIHAYLAAPIQVGQETAGVVAFGMSSLDRSFDNMDAELVRELGRRAGYALANAKAYAEAKRATQLRDDVVAIVSHDLRNDIGAVLTTGALMAREVATPLALKRVEVLQRSANHMNRLITDLTDFAALQSGQLTLRLEPADPCTLVRQAIDNFSALAEERRIRLTAECSGSVPRILCDADRIVQVLSNLVSNAIKAVAALGNVTVIARREGQVVCFEVVDDGPGIPAEDLPRIFDRYWRARGAPYHGTGLGLSIAKSIVEAHGGSIRMDSVRTEGCRIRFELPIRESPS